MQIKFWRSVFILLFLVLSALILAFSQTTDLKVRIIACDVGQGDAILVTYGMTQILTDGGPDRSVLDCLGKYMPFWDREIELVISSHPDSDHITGLTYVLENYKVSEILINPIDPGTEGYRLLRNMMGGGAVDVIRPIEGMKMSIGMIHLDILSPSDNILKRLTPLKNSEESLQYSVSGSSNLYSIVYRLSFKNFTGIFPGDIPPEVSDSIALYPQDNKVEYIKIPHHGSKNGITENLLKALDPELAVISVGKNPWGLPSQDILNLLGDYNIQTIRTDEAGDVVVETDGESYQIK